MALHKVLSVSEHILYPDIWHYINKGYNYIYIHIYISIMFVRRVDEDHSSHLGVVGAGSGECADG